MRRLTRLLAVTAMAMAALVLVPAPPASAHPLGNFTINLYDGITVLPGRIQVFHVLDMAEIPTFQEMSRIDTDGDGEASATERAAWASRKASELAAGVTVAVDGRRVPLTVRSATMRFRPGQAGLSILRMEATFVARTPRTGAISFHDGNYADRIGWREVTAVGANGAVLAGSSLPSRSVSDALLSYPKDLLSSPLHVTDAAFSFHPGQSGPAPAPATAADSEGRPGVSGGSFAGLVDRSLTLPFVLLALVLAMGFGALHALAPGHGKTIMAAYLVGAQGKVRQALVGGAAVSAMHTASVLTVGLLILSAEQVFPPERVYPWLGLISGIVVVALGGVLLYVRTRAARRKGHDHEHEHEHQHEHAALDPSRPLLSKRGLAALAAAGGLLPSPTALVVLLAAVALHRVAFGIALILAFSVGLAAALAIVGIVAIRARDLFARKLNGRMGQLVPVGSAAVIMAAGGVLLARAALQL